MIFIIIIVFLCAKGGAETDCFFFLDIWSGKGGFLVISSVQ